jgi:hypothetical protein
MWNPAWVLRDWIKSPGKVSIHLESNRIIPGVQQDSLVVNNGCYLKKSPDGVLMDAWLSVTTSKMGIYEGVFWASKNPVNNRKLCDKHWYFTTQIYLDQSS